MKKILIFAMAAFILGACSNEDEMLVNDNKEIRLVSNVKSPISRGASLTQQSTQIVIGQKVGAWLTDGTTDTPLYSNTQLTAGDEGTLTPTTAMQWGDHSSVKVYAYHPYNTGWEWTSANSFTVATDQSTDANYLNSDLLYTPQVATGNKVDNNAVSLDFSHALAKINVKLVDDENNGLSGASVSIVGTKLTATFTPSTNTLGVATGTTVDIKAAITTSTGTAAAIIIPQSVSGKFIEVIYNNKRYYYSLTTEKEFAGAHSYTYTLQLSDTQASIALSLVSATIADWTDEPSSGLAFFDKEIIDPEIGHFYYSDGTYSSTFKAGCIGVIFSVNNDKKGGKVVSLDENSGVQWSTDNAVLNCADQTNGSFNTNLIKSQTEYTVKYPATAWCVAKGDGWYLPAIDELEAIYTAKETLGTSLVSASGTPFGTSNAYYLSSTESDNAEWADRQVFSYNFSDDAGTRKGYTDKSSSGDWARYRAVCTFAVSE